MSLTLIFSASTWPNIKSKVSFEILRTSRFQNWPYFLNLVKIWGSYCQKQNFKILRTTLYFPWEATSSHLIERLKNFFCIFGIPEEYQVTMGHNSSQPSWNSSSRAGGWRTTESVQHIIHIVTYEQRQLSNQVNGYLWTIQDLMDHQIGTE